MAMNSKGCFYILILLMAAMTQLSAEVPRELLLEVTPPTHENIEEAMVYATDLIAEHDMKVKGLHVAGIGTLSAIVLHWLYTQYTGRNHHKEILTRLGSVDREITGLQARLLQIVQDGSGRFVSPFVSPNSQEGSGSMPPFLYKVKDNVIGLAGDIASGVGGIAKLGLVSVLAVPVMYVAKKIVSGILEQLDIVNFVEIHTNFKTHIFSVLEAFEDYAACLNSPEVTDDRKNSVLLMLTFAGNCLMHDIGYIIGYIKATAYQFDGDELTEAQLQEKKVLEHYSLIMAQIASDMAHLLNQVADSEDGATVVALEHKFHGMTQRIVNECHALVRIEHMLARDA
jgi:hypothetical protein